MRRQKPKANCKECRGIGFVSIAKPDGYTEAKPCACTVPPKSQAEKQREQVIGRRVLDAILSQGGK